MRNTPLVPGCRHRRVHEVELMVGAEDGSETVEAVPLGDLVGEAGGVRVAVAGVQPYQKTVGEHLAGSDGGVGQQEQEEGKGEEGGGGQGGVE